MSGKARGNLMESRVLVFAPIGLEDGSFDLLLEYVATQKKRPGHVLCRDDLVGRSSNHITRCKALSSKIRSIPSPKRA